MLAPASVLDYRAIAERRLPRLLFGYVDGGSYDENTLRANQQAFARIRLKQRILRDVSSLETRTSLFGRELSLPIALAPIGFAGMMARRAEVQAAQAAEKAGVPFTLSTVGICPIEEVRRATGRPFWFQLYMMRDRGVVRAMLEQAQAAGCEVLVFTVDLPVLGKRYRDLRNGMGARLSLLGRLRLGLDFATHLRWVCDVGLRGRPLTFGNLANATGRRGLFELLQWTATQIDPSVTWKDLEWVRAFWKGPLVLKGVLDVEDARSAVSCGADGVVVSNHGGRQLDSAPASLEMLPEIAAAVGDRTEVLMDGGVRSGQDVAKALALGARACLVGRPWVYGVAAAGRRGVAAVIDTLAQELRVTMALLGVTRVAQIDRSLLED
jgi:L-lactate dehydrogenase (cytochrome)